VSVNLHFTDKYAIAFADSDDIVITKLTEAVYPNWKHVVPTSFNFTYLTDSKVFNDGLKHIIKVMKVMDVESFDQIIRFTFDDCVAKMHHQSKVKKEPIVIEHDIKLPFVTSQLPDGFSFNFNADRLQRILTSFDDDVKWSINESMTPIKFSVDDQYYVICMPCRGN
jgi:DNA polymerase III sliding clamp (beta) subunit (PCNA family)